VAKLDGPFVEVMMKDLITKERKYLREKNEKLLVSNWLI
jgi:hypothetical protein